MIFVDTRQNKSLYILIKIILVAISLSKKIENKSEDYLELEGFVGRVMDIMRNIEKCT